MHRRAKRLNNLGITMVELMVSLLILSIVIVLAGSMLLSSGNVFTHSAQMNTNKMAGDAVYTYMSERLIFAERMQILFHEDAIKPRYATTFHVEDGRLYERTRTGERDVFGDTFYQGRTLAVTARAYAAHKLELTIDIRDAAGGTLYRTSSTIDAVNVRQAGLTIEDRAMQVIENPQISYTGPGAVTTTRPATTTTTTAPPTTSTPSTTMTTVTTTTTVPTTTTRPQPDWGDPPRTVGDEIRYAPAEIPVLQPHVQYIGGQMIVTTYKKGDFVQYKGEIYRCLRDGSYWDGGADDAPGMPHSYDVWKLISQEYDQHCTYERLDIVEYKGTYYQSMVDFNTYVPGKSGETIWRKVVYHPEDDTWKTPAGETVQERDWPPIP